MSFEPPDLSDLHDMEIWAQHAAAYLREHDPQLSMEVALATAHWTAMWLEDFGIRLSERRPTTREELVDAMRTTRQSSLDRVEGLPRDPSGSPGYQAVHDVCLLFLLGAGEERAKRYSSLIGEL